MLSQKQQEQYDRMRFNLLKIIEAKPDWTNAKIAKAYSLADPNSPTLNTIRLLVGKMRSPIQDNSHPTLEEINEIKSLI